jgi:glycosyltransferase involved in cell wall biosynthesis
LLLGDEELRIRIGKNAADYAGSFDWKVITDQILELYAGLVPRSA